MNNQNPPVRVVEELMTFASQRRRREREMLKAQAKARRVMRGECPNVVSDDEDEERRDLEEYIQEVAEMTALGYNQ